MSVDTCHRISSVAWVANRIPTDMLMIMMMKTFFTLETQSIEGANKVKLRPERIPSLRSPSTLSAGERLHSPLRKLQSIKNEGNVTVAQRLREPFLIQSQIEVPCF